MTARASSSRILTVPVPSKNELGADYGMGSISGIGKEWNEQAQALADYVVGKTADEVLGIAVDEATKPAEADLASSVTISIGGFQNAIAEAVDRAQPLGAQAEDELRLVTSNSMAAGNAPEGRRRHGGDQCEHRRRDHERRCHHLLRDRRRAGPGQL